MKYLTSKEKGPLRGQTGLFGNRARALPSPPGRV